MERDNEFVVWVLSEVSHEWIDWVKVGSAHTLEEAQKLGAMRGGYWGIRRNTEPKPSYVLGDDGRWVGV